MHIGSVDTDRCGCGLAGIPTAELSGLGFTDSVSTATVDCSGLPILERLACEARKLLSRTQEISRPVPVYTPPYSGYPTEYGETYQPETNWMPFLIGGLVLFALTRRGR